MAISILMLDTSAYTAFRQGHVKVAGTVQRAQSILIPMIVLGELLAGFEVGRRREANLRELEEFQSSPRVRVVQVGKETAKRYAHIYAHLRSVGRPIPTNNLWIAALAMEYGAALISADAHFLYIPQIFTIHFSRNI